MDDGASFSEQIEKIEKALEERLRGAVARFRSPKREEIQVFQQRLDRLAARVQALSGGGR
ncbi:MAG: phasin family protein [Myxococcaceae bacterium]